MIFNKLIIVALWFPSEITKGAVGDVILWPVVTSSEITNVGAGSKITATIDMVPIRQSKASNILPSDLVLAVVGPGGINWSNSNAYVGYGKTWQQASDLWFQQFGLHTVIERNVSNMNWAGGCVGMTIDRANTNSPTGYWNGLLSGPGDSFRCTTIPASAYRCQITQTALVIDYGRVKTIDANGKSASVPFNINCDGDVNISITGTAGGASVPLGTGLTAQLSIDGGPLGSSMKITKGITDHTLSAVLFATNVNPGSYNSSTALIINYL